MYLSFAHYYESPFEVNNLKRYRNYYIEKWFQIEKRIDNENAYKYCIQIPIRNLRKLWLTTNVATAQCTTRNLSRDRGVPPHAYIKSRLTRFNISCTRGYCIGNT